MTSATLLRSAHLASLDRLYVSVGHPSSSTLEVAHATTECPEIGEPGAWAPVDEADGWICSVCVDVDGVVITAAGVSVDAPERGEPGGSRSPVESGPAVVTWAKHDDGSWVLRVPVSLDAAEGATVTVHKASGETVEAVLGPKVGTRRGDRLHAPARSASTSSSVRPNRHPGRCDRCGVDVPAEAGRIEKKNGRWVVFHLDGACSTAPAPVAAPVASAPAEELEVDRIYGTDRGEIVKVCQAQAGHLYGKVRVPGGWEFSPGSLGRISGPVSAEVAASFGHEHHHCCFCGRSLSDDGPARSVEIGYGPVCAGKYGLPWG